MDKAQCVALILVALCALVCSLTLGDVERKDQRELSTTLAQLRSLRPPVVGRATGQVRAASLPSCRDLLGEGEPGCLPCVFLDRAAMCVSPLTQACRGTRVWTVMQT